MGAYQDRKQAQGQNGEKKSDLVRIAGLWKLKSKKGLMGGVDEKALDAIAEAIQKSGGKASFLLFANNRKKEKSPDYVLFVAPSKNNQSGGTGGTQTTANREQAKDEFADMF